MYNVSEHAFAKLISDRDRQIIEVVNAVSITSSICVFGCVTNVINIIVFCKQGFQQTMNITLLAITISDLCSLVTLLWAVTCVNPQLVDSPIPIAPKEIQYLTGSLPHICFARITSWITVYITAERFVCITFPLQVKQLITPRKTTVIIMIIYIAMIASFSPEYITCYFEWKFFEERNRTLIGLAFRGSRKSMEGLIFFLSTMSGLVSFISVSVFTILLVVQLKRKSKWRTTANLDPSASLKITARDRKTIGMVVMIAGVLIASYTPSVLTSLVTVVEPELSIVGRYVNACFVSWSFTFIFDALNSSINIFIYYTMGSKYRETLHQVLGVCNLVQAVQISK